jgi:WD40 repeated domain
MLQCQQVRLIVYYFYRLHCRFSIYMLTHFLSSLKTVCEVNLAPAVNRMLSNCDNIIQQHKAACLRVTSLLAHKDIIWVGTSAGVLLTILAQNIGKSTPVVTGIIDKKVGQVTVVHCTFSYRHSTRSHWSRPFFDIS